MIAAVTIGLVMNLLPVPVGRNQTGTINIRKTMTNYEEYKIQKEEELGIGTYRAKLVSTTNSHFEHYEGLVGMLVVSPIGFSPKFRPDNFRYDILTTSWLIEVEEYSQYAGDNKEVLVLKLKTKNSIYIFEAFEENLNES